MGGACEGGQSLICTYLYIVSICIADQDLHYEGTEKCSLVHADLNPCPAEPGYTLPLKTV